MDFHNKVTAHWRREEMTLSPKIHTWKQLDAELRLIGTRLFYVNFWTVGGSLSLDNGRIVAHTVKDALVFLADS